MMTTRGNWSVLYQLGMDAFRTSLLVSITYVDEVEGCDILPMEKEVVLSRGGRGGRAASESRQVDGAGHNADMFSTATEKSRPVEREKATAAGQ